MDELLDFVLDVLLDEPPLFPHAANDGEMCSCCTEMVPDKECCVNCCDYYGCRGFAEGLFKLPQIVFNILSAFDSLIGYMANIIHCLTCNCSEMRV